MGWEKTEKTPPEKTRDSLSHDVGDLRVGCKTVCRAPFLIYHSACGKEISGDLFGVAVTEAVVAPLQRFFKFFFLESCSSVTQEHMSNKTRAGSNKNRHL